MALQEKPREVAAVIAGILQVGILRIRGAGIGGDAELCAIEADHIHNLPALAASPKESLLQFYWNVERPSYLEAIRRHAEATADPVEFAPLWAELSKHLGSTGSTEPL